LTIKYKALKTINFTFYQWLESKKIKKKAKHTQQNLKN